MNNIFRVGLESPVSATIAAGLALWSIGGQALADPQSTPTITLAPYVLKSTILEEGATRAYRPWFEDGARTGDLIEYHISQAGERCTSVAVGAFPADDAGNAVACPYGNWSARGAFPDKIASPDGTLIDEPAAATYWQTRNVFMFRDGETKNKVPFWWNELTTAQKQTVDPITCGLDVDGNCSALDIDQSSPQASVVLNYIRGDRSLERDKAGGIFRLRYSLLGSIINSRPVFAPVGDGIVVVGANDGMVHGFDATNGNEIFGYVPSMLLPGLENLTETPYQFTYSADGELRYRNIATNQHIVAGGLGAGGKGLFVLDVTTPADPAVLFELSGNDGSHIDANHYLPYLGHIYGRPTIARLPDNEWYVVAGNGYGSGAGPLLVLIRISDGVITTIGPNPALVDDAENGLSAPALVDVNSDGKVDFAYAGDLQGNLWRFDLTGRFATRLFAAGAGKPITVEPDIARHPSGVGIMIYFGTGRLLNVSDVDDQSTQSIFGIWDEDFVTAELPGNSLLVNTLTPLTGTWDNSTRFVRIVEDEQLPNWYGIGRNLGWRVDLPRAGERLLGRPQVRADRIQFITTHPPSYLESLVPGDGSWFIQLSLESGGSLNPPVPLYDLDRSGVLDEGDALLLQDDNNPDADPVAYYPLGLNLGPGNIAQPAFARVEQDIDAVFVNALLLPVPPDPDDPGIGFGGDMDVTTDSPAGPMVSPHDAGHPRFSLYGTAYPDPSSPNSPPARGPMNMHLEADGLGDTVDGHHRAYDKVHGVNYVDFFDIEPRARRSLLRLDAGTLYQTVDANGDPIQQPFTAIRELNQPLESPWGNPLFGEDQKFIVVLSNADLSQGTELRIGCRTWNSFDYQQMITPQLKANTPPALLRDENGGSLVFSMAGIRDEVCADGASPTLRITVTGRVGAEDVLHGTLPGCVNNTHGYDGLLKLPDTHPHITPNQEQQASGYRWRNGALTMQLLAVNADDSAGYLLQTTNLPVGSRTIGNGGIFAAAFSVAKVQGKDVITPLAGPNGLLYEASVFWNFGDMWEFQQAGQPIQCYGTSFYNAALTNEIGGLNSGQYNGLVENLRVDQTLLDAYADAIALLANAQTEEQVRFALMALAALFDDQAGSWGRHDVLTLADFHRLRSYAHGDKFKLDLLDIDRDLFEPPPPVEVEVDGTPANVQDIELDLLPAAGPNYAPGRRSWIDITPVQ
jgi:hypothetical protein